LTLFFCREINPLTVYAYLLGNSAKNQVLLAGPAVTWRFSTTLSTGTVDSCGDAMAIALTQTSNKPPTTAGTAEIEVRWRDHG
jgi:hypothetical protein